MLFEVNDLIHIYNRGNNKQQIFFNDDNYSFFLEKANKHIFPVADILAYCLMPNHFHFLVRATDHSCKPKNIGNLISTELANGFRILQSSYTAAINKKASRTGSLFQQNCKYKILVNSDTNNALHNDYATICFHYIHQNPLKAQLTDKLENWKFSSFNEYMHTRKFSLCKTEAAYEVLDISRERFYDNSYQNISPELLEKIF